MRRTISVALGKARNAAPSKHATRVSETREHGQNWPAMASLVKLRNDWKYRFSIETLRTLRFVKNQDDGSFRIQQLSLDGGKRKRGRSVLGLKPNSAEPDSVTAPGMQPPTSARKLEWAISERRNLAAIAGSTASAIRSANLSSST